VDIDVADGILAKIKAADEARFGSAAVPPPADASPEELERFLAVRRPAARQRRTRARRVRALRARLLTPLRARACCRRAAAEHEVARREAFAERGGAGCDAARV
jgi:hypothetical protein